ncbi:alcohol dehydrogenase-like 4 isoform X1 [Setaria italica]|uniref:alcohol dehydrogenase-like 4 isoform X1 n=1 Tax=Setaria italica TaxID=4555 RepID=UPI000350D33F|nr:alcohol dehydrogenase-like 4 isoform X1 [Setaria italica]
MASNGNGSLANGASTHGKPIKCKAAVAWGPGEPLAMEEVEVAPPGRREVRVKLLFTSICHTDLSFLKGENEQQRKFPRILGHEAAGVVESVGDGVEDLAPGDHVVPIFNGECGACAYCKSGKTNLCGTYRVNPFKSTMTSDGGTRFSVVDASSGERRPVYHFLNTSTFAEYTVLDAACAVKVHPKAPLEKMCLLSCGISTVVLCLASGVGAAWNTANVSTGSTVAVFGLGAVGLAVAEGARLRGAARIIGVDINPEKFTKGKEMGVTDFIDSKACDKPVHEVIREMTDGGVDYSFECTGINDVLREAFLSTHDGWGLTVVLGIHATPKMMPLHPMELFDGRRITGCVFGDFKGKSQLPDIVDKCMSGELKVNFDGFITHKMPFSDTNKAIQLLEEGKSLRCVLHF